MPDVCNSCEEDVSVDAVYCNGGCKKIFHRTCTTLNKAAVKYINECVNIKWLCNECLHLSDSMAKMQEKMVQVLEILQKHEEKFDNQAGILSDLQKKVDVSITVQKQSSDALKNSISSQNVNKGKVNSVSFAEVLKNKNEEPVVVIKPKKGDQSSETTKKIVKEKIDPTKVQVNDLRNVSNGGVVMRCNNKADVDECKKMIENELGTAYDVSVPEQKRPSLKIVGLSEMLDKEEIVSKIKAQNDFVNQDSFIEVKALWQKKSVISLVIKTDGETFQKMIEQERIYIGWDRCRVFEHFHFQHCFNCAGFHHLAKDCKNAVQCPRCAGKHPLKECSSKTEQCANCLSINANLKMNVPTNHPAWSRDCSVYLRKISVERSKIKYSK
jgi:hypothetical protein